MNEIKNPDKNTISDKNNNLSEKNVEENNNKEIDYINQKKLKKLEKEKEEINERISNLREKLIESKKGAYCDKVKISEREVLTVIEQVYPVIEKEESLLELEPPLYN